MFLTAPVAEGMACVLAESDEPYTIKRDGAYKIQFSGKEGKFLLLLHIFIFQLFANYKFHIATNYDYS